MTIGDGVTNIGDLAFEGCIALTTVTMGKNVATISQGAFANCTVLISLTFTSTMEQWNRFSFGTNWRKGVPATKVICSDGEVALG